MTMLSNETMMESCEDPSLCEKQSGDGNLGLAFGLTIGAGLATSLGAMLPFIPMIKRANTIILSAGLALAAGVMLYVSFTEILGKSIGNFCCITEHSTLAAVGCFFGGVLVTVLLDLLATGMQKLDCGWKWPWCREQRESLMSRLRDFFRALFKCRQANQDVTVQMEKNSDEGVSMDALPAKKSGNSSSPVDSGLQQESGILEDKGMTSTASSGDSEGQDVIVDVKAEGDDLKNGVALGPEEFKDVTETLEKDTKKLHKMGLLTALAIGLHNFPEGMATFVAALSSPSLGIALAIAIALHNVPEGLCVALPVYYATGSRWKGFLWAFLSGVSEPIGALLGWAILKDIFGPAVFGVAFGLIAGMMVFISLKELLPMAYKFDNKQGRVVTLFLAVGMLIMALSLILFLY